MHDVGKIGIPDRILLKADHSDERRVMEEHTLIGTASSPALPPNCFRPAPRLPARTTNAGMAPVIQTGWRARRSR